MLRPHWRLRCPAASPPHALLLLSCTVSRGRRRVSDCKTTQSHIKWNRLPQEPWHCPPSEGFCKNRILNFLIVLFIWFQVLDLSSSSSFQVCRLVSNKQSTVSGRGCLALAVVLHFVVHSPHYVCTSSGFCFLPFFSMKHKHTGNNVPTWYILGL